MNTIFIIFIVVTSYEHTCADTPVPSESTYVFNNDKIAEGDYSFRFATPDNQIIRRESGYFMDEEGKDYIVTGLYSYIDPEGKTHLITYYADKTGYHPTIVKETDAPKPDADKSVQSISETSFAIPPAIVGSLLG